MFDLYDMRCRLFACHFIKKALHFSKQFKLCMIVSAIIVNVVSAGFPWISQNLILIITQLPEPRVFDASSRYSSSGLVYSEHYLSPAFYSFPRLLFVGSIPLIPGRDWLQRGHTCGIAFLRRGFPYGVFWPTFEGWSRRYTQRGLPRKSKQVASGFHSGWRSL